jgi:AcrR family transcriptional regulator
MSDSMSEPGLRERKKQRTRELIADTARRLFVERGFDRVPVTEIARQAEVSEATVYNYFPRKEDLLYWRLESFEQELLDAIRARAPGESFLAAFGRFVLQPRGLLAAQDPETIEFFAALTRTIVESPALLARERELLDRYTTSLASLIAEQTGAGAEDLEPWVAANALMGVHRALVDYTRRRILAGARNPRLARDVRTRGRRALETLATALAEYGAT